VDEQRHRLAQVQDQVRDDVHSSWLDVEANAARVVQTESEMKSAQDALAISLQQYAAGTATSLDLSQAQRDAFNGEANFAQSRSDLAAALLALRKAAGETIWGSP
jgi:outer membrane protein TolC